MLPEKDKTTGKPIDPILLTYEIGHALQEIPIISYALRHSTMECTTGHYLHPSLTATPEARMAIEYVRDFMLSLRDGRGTKYFVEKWIGKKELEARLSADCTIAQQSESER